MTEAKSGIFDEKSGTRPEKVGRMVTLTMHTIIILPQQIYLFVTESSMVGFGAKTKAVCTVGEGLVCDCAEVCAVRVQFFLSIICH